MTTTARGRRVGLWPNQLAVARNKANMTQAELAAQIGVGQTTVASIERGIISGRRYMSRIVEILEVENPSEVFPYFHYRSIEEASKLSLVPASTISRNIKAGKIPYSVFGGIKMLSADLVESDSFRSWRKDPSTNTREVVLEALQQCNNGGLTSDELVNLLETDEDRSERAILSAESEQLLRLINDLRSHLRVCPPEERRDLINRIEAAKSERASVMRRRDKRKQTIQSILSRSEEFFSDKSFSPPRWRLHTDATSAP